MKKIILLLMCFLIPSYSFAVIHPKDQAKIILYSGLYGSVLGLSTLSFYDKPADHRRNIAMGAALGLMAAIIITTVVATKESKKKIQEELILKGQTPSTNPTQNNQLDNKAKEDPKDKKTNTNKDTKKDTKKEEDFFKNMDDYDDEDYDDFDEDDDYYMFNNKIKVDILFASFNKNKLSLNSNFINLYQNPNNNKIDFYTNVINVRF